MGLQRVPGVRHYRANPAGLREVGRWSSLGAAALDVARSVAAVAEQLGHGTYEAAAAGVRAGYDNEYRAGAVVREKQPSLRDRKGRVLLTAASGPVHGPQPRPNVPLNAPTGAGSSTRRPEGGR